ncbi:MAG: hypothetical protein AAF702_12690 [Chloroflexota bacterium]
MISKRLTQLVVAFVLTVAVASGSGVVAEQLGFDVTPTIYACSSQSGGGC